MNKVVSAIGSVLRVLFLKGKKEAEKVAPEVQAQIDRILAEANSAVSSIKQSNSVAALRAQMEADIQAVEDTAKHHVALIKQSFELKLASATVLLPPVSSQLGAAPGATGPTGGTVGSQTGPT